MTRTALLRHALSQALTQSRWRILVAALCSERFLSFFGPSILLSMILRASSNACRECEARHFQFFLFHACCVRKACPCEIGRCTAVDCCCAN